MYKVQEVVTHSEILWFWLNIIPVNILEQTVTVTAVLTF